MKMVVTGGKGFIGSNLVEYLLSKGHEVVVVDFNKDSGYEDLNALYYYNDITKPIHNAEDIFKDARTVFHLAAEIYVQKSLEFPDLFRDVNELGTKKILDYCVAAGVCNFILSSTSAIYGNTSYGRGSLEDDKVDCLNAYSESKYAAELICKEYTETYGINVTVLRYFNVYGKRQHETGQYAPVIGKFLKQKQAGERLTVVGDGSQKRDFINVYDVVTANYAAHKNANGFNLYNIGHGSNISVLDLAKLISTDITFIDPRDGECKETLADTHKAQEELAWKPTISVQDYLLQ